MSTTEQEILINKLKEQIVTQKDIITELESEVRMFKTLCENLSIERLRHEERENNLLEQIKELEKRNQYTELKDEIDSLKFEIKSLHEDYQSRMLNIQEMAEIEIKIRNEINKKEAEKSEKLIDELKQVKSILKAPMLYFKFRDKTFSEISRAQNNETQLDPEIIKIFSESKEHTLIYKEKKSRKLHSENRKRSFKTRKGFSLPKN